MIESNSKKTSPKTHEESARFFLDHKFRSPTCPDLEKLIAFLGKNFNFDRKGFYDNNGELVAAIDRATIIFDNKKIFNQPILYTLPKSITLDFNFTVKVITAICEFEGCFYALELVCNNTWEVKRKLTQNPPAEIIRALQNIPN